MNMFGKIAIAGATVIVSLQLICPSIPSGPTSVEIQAPPRVRQILAKDCYRRYDGLDLREQEVVSAAAAKQTKFILSLKPAWLS